MKKTTNARPYQYKKILKTMPEEMVGVIKPGSVFWMEDAFTDKNGERKHHPYCVLSDKYAEYGDVVMVGMTTSPTIEDMIPIMSRGAIRYLNPYRLYAYNITDISNKCFIGCISDEVLELLRDMVGMTLGINNANIVLDKYNKYIKYMTDKYPEILYPENNELPLKLSSTISSTSSTDITATSSSDTEDIEDITIFTIEGNVVNATINDSNINRIIDYVSNGGAHEYYKKVEDVASLEFLYRVKGPDVTSKLLNMTAAKTRAYHASAISRYVFNFEEDTDIITEDTSVMPMDNPYFIDNDNVVNINMDSNVIFEIPWDMPRNMGKEDIARELYMYHVIYHGSCKEMSDARNVPYQRMFARLTSLKKKVGGVKLYN